MRPVGNHSPRNVGVRTVSNRLPELHKLVLHLKASNTMCGIEPLSQLRVRRYVLYPLSSQVLDSNQCKRFCRPPPSQLGQPDIISSILLPAVRNCFLLSPSLAGWVLELYSRRDLNSQPLRS